MIKGRICPQCLCDLEQEYIEEGDHRLCITPVKCPYCGWNLDNGGIEEVPRHPAPPDNQGRES